MADDANNSEIERKEDEVDQENSQLITLGQEKENIVVEEEKVSMSIDVDVTESSPPHVDNLKEEEVEVEIQVAEACESAPLEPPSDLKHMTLGPEVQANVSFVAEESTTSTENNHLTLKVEVEANMAVKYLEEHLAPIDGPDSPVLEDANIVIHQHANDHQSADPPVVHQLEVATALSSHKAAVNSNVEVPPHPVDMVLASNEASSAPSAESHAPTSHQLKPDAEPKKELLKKFNLSSAAQGSGDMCHVCHKRVYPTERISANERIFHKNCFRCTKCHGILSPRNFTFYNEELLCKPHYIERFKVAGRYNDPVAATSSTHVPETNHVSPKVAPSQSRTPLTTTTAVTHKANDSSVTRQASNVESATTRNGTDYAESARDMWRKRDQRFSKSLNEIEVKKDASPSQPLNRKASIPSNEPIMFGSSGTVKDRMRMFENKAHQVISENGSNMPHKLTKSPTGVKKVAFMPIERASPDASNPPQMPAANEDERPPPGLAKQRAALFEKR